MEQGEEIVPVVVAAPAIERVDHQITRGPGSWNAHSLYSGGGGLGGGVHGDSGVWGVGLTVDWGGMGRDRARDDEEKDMLMSVRHQKVLKSQSNIFLISLPLP